MTLKICEPAIYELLKALASGAVFLLRAPPNHAGPFIIIQRTDSLRWRAINGTAGGWAQAYIQVDAYASTYYAAKALGAAAEDILEGYDDTVAYGDNSPQDTVDIGGITLQNDTDILDQTDEPALFRSSASYLVTYRQ